MTQDLATLDGVVGICGSTGALEALKEFVESMPADSGLAVVVIFHRSPQAESHLRSILQERTELRVENAEPGGALKPNHIYVVPPALTVTLEGSSFKVRQPDSEESRRRPSDALLHSLAMSLGRRSIGIILSGMGSDGTIGLRRIREEGGLTIVQQPETAQNQAMIRNAMEALDVDQVLEPKTMPSFLAGYVRRLSELERKEAAEADENLQSSLHEICRIVKGVTGHDFQYYKKNTLVRRIQRRMLVKNCGSVDDYQKLIGNDPEETRSLFREFLISVTGFFRDPDAYEALRDHIVKELLPKAKESFRVWVPACATGEEVYSMAILLTEILEDERSDCRLQVFATDIDEAALLKARSGRYPEGIADQVSEGRLHRFFHHEKDHYQVSKELRSRCLFSRHNILSDPPFSRIDITSCRNFLIYLESNLQSQVIKTLHYSLVQSGILFLGQSESLSEHSDLFHPLDKSHRVFKALDSHNTFPPTLRTPGSPVAFDSILGTHQDARSHHSVRRSSLPRTVFEKLGLTIVVFDSQDRILETFGTPDKFFALRSGPPDHNLLSLAREEVRLHLRTAIHTSRKEGKISTTLVRSLVGAGADRYELSVIPDESSGGADPARWIAVFKEQATEEGESLPDLSQLSSDPVVAQLESELENTRLHLQTTVEELETSNEELRSSNEELISVNEELQSSNEELETSKEELQSVNEELETVNSELQEKISELDKAHSDLWNFFQSTPAPTVFLDRDLRVEQFTPAASEVFRLIPSDLGRPLTDVNFLLRGVDLTLAVNRALQGNQKDDYALESQTEPKRYYTLRVLPYENFKKEVEGVVLTFFETTTIHRTRERTQLQVDRQRELAQIGAEALRGEPIPSLVRKALLSLQSLLGVGLAVFVTPGGRRSEAWWYDHVGWRDLDNPPPAFLTMEGCRLLAEAVSTDGPFTRDLDEMGDALAPWESSHSVRHGLALRLGQEEDPYGYLLAYHKEGTFCPDAGGFFLSLGNILLNALIRNDEERLAQLKAETAAHLAGHTRLEDTFRPLLRTFGNYLNADYLELWRPDENAVLKRTYFETVGRLETSPDFDNQACNEELQSNDCLVGRVYRDKNLEWVHDLRDSNLFHRQQVVRQHQLRGGLGIPLLADDQCIGVMLFLSSKAIRETERVHRAAMNLSLAMGEFSKRLRAERALRDREAHLHQALRKAPFPLFFLNEDGEFPVVSEAVTELTGHRPEDLHDVQSWIESVFSSEKVQPRQDVERLFDLNHSLRDGQFEVYTKDGSILIWDFYTAPLGPDPQGRETLIGMAYDVTEREQTRNELQQLSERKDRFLATLGHELRNPLAAIRNSLTLLEGTDAIEQTDARWVEVISRQSDQMTELLNGLLDLSRISRGKISLQKQVCDIAELTAASTEASTCMEDGHSLEFHRPDRPLWAQVDPTRWTQIVDNLLSNAKKFTPEDERIEIRLEAVDETILLRVSDTGCGIAPENLDHMFEAFYQADGEARNDGLGLGLALVKHLVERHHGEIRIESDGLGKGTTVEVALPQCSPPDPSQKATDEELEEVRWDILLVEDEIDISETQKELLRRLGHRTRTATNADDAIAVFRERRPDIVLCDIRIEGNRSGLELVKEFKKEALGVPVLALTGYGLREDESVCRQAGFDGHLSKPLGLKRLRAALRKFTNWRYARGLRVLIVDDNKMVLATMKAMLAKHGALVESCCNGGEAVEIAESFHPDLVLLDLKLKDESGTDVLKRLRAIEALSKTTFVAISGGELSEQEAAQFDQTLIKPASQDQFLELCYQHHRRLNDS
jgi:two-component system, chemotaxis family, CheB/CheR fusion protein